MHASAAGRIAGTDLVRPHGVSLALAKHASHCGVLSSIGRRGERLGTLHGLHARRGIGLLHELERNKYSV